MNQISSKVDQNEGTRIMDSFMDKFRELKIAISPVISGLASFADQESEANDNQSQLAK